MSSDGHYESYRPGGGGDYTFSLDTRTIGFRNGDYHYWEYRGLYQPSSDARARIVLMPLNATKPIRTERPGEYQYCYLEPSTSNAKD